MRTKGLCSNGQAVGLVTFTFQLDYFAFQRLNFQAQPLRTRDAGGGGQFERINEHAEASTVRLPSEPWDLHRC